jgi:hypothetical protein
VWPMEGVSVLGVRYWGGYFGAIYACARFGGVAMAGWRDWNLSKAASASLPGAKMLNTPPRIGFPPCDGELVCNATRWRGQLHGRQRQASAGAIQGLGREVMEPGANTRAAARNRRTH